MQRNPDFATSKGATRMKACVIVADISCYVVLVLGLKLI